MKEIRLFIKDESEMSILGQKIAACLQGNELIYLQGALGAGKTVLTRGIARGLGYKGHITSPTFTIMNIYSNTPPIYHYDLYRLEKGDLWDLGWEDYVGQGGVTIIEWPEAGRGFLPEPTINILIELENNDYEAGRSVIISGIGSRFRTLMEELI